jgi:chromatin remodeling complex protein RSC6
MVRQSKSTEKPSVPAADVPVVAAAPKPRAKKAAKAAEPAVDATAPVENTLAPQTEPVAAATDASVLSVKMTEYSAKLQQYLSLGANLKNDFKTLEKMVAREMKAAQKATSRRRRNNTNRKPSGFIKPTRISDELANFLGKTVGTEMARTEVSKEINTYIMSNGLQDKTNGRRIHADAKLTQLLKLNTGDELTYFNLQRYMKHHFVKAEPVAEPVATA